MNSAPYDLYGKSILVTGGTGSFGESFVRRVIQEFAPRRLSILARDEYKQFHMAEKVHGPTVRYVVGDVRDPGRLQRVFADVDVVVHAAAMKHVPIAEFNPIECIRTNVLGAENVINAAIDSGVDRVVALSTDKATNPINLYGATKLCSDKLFVAANSLVGEGGTRFSVVRYGNVVGSRGSVIPFFKERRKTGRLPITDARMTRFWITMDKGVDFVLRVLTMMDRGEVFIPKQPSMRMVDLATAVAPECEQEITGIRPGEKIHEVLIPADESGQTLEFDNFFVIQPAFHESWGLKLSDVYAGQRGRPVAPGFEYRSDNNPEWMTAEALHLLTRD
ncbi:UDP-N-acetylglucosamine 4,6-dehydratase (inverting) [Nonomuraea purpurea]|uniref:UDP-N-acetylglucosamine 4,6-dehydratase (Inverting) n=1 Tax=Nonomuraea purpurea TaxID=1849276 RepID=A0ABV8GNR3_9ACTN